MKTAEIILKLLRASDRKNPAEVQMKEVGNAKIVAAKNPFINGFAVVVVSGNGERYGVTGFKKKPSESALEEAVSNAESYAIANNIA